MAIVTKYCTLTQLGQAFREKFRNAKSHEAAKLAKWLLDRIADGTYTDTQVRNFFGLTQTQYNQMKTRLTALRDHWIAVENAQGE